MNVSKWVLCLASVAAVGILGFVAAPEQQDDSLRIEITRSGLRIPIAVPDFIAVGVGEEYNRAAAEIAQIVREDLQKLDIFNLADSAVYRQIGRHTEDDIPFARYAEYKIDALTMAKVIPDSRGLKVEVRLFSIPDKSTLFGKAVVGRSDQQRYIAHTIASNILYHFTGQFGVFRSRIVYSSNRELNTDRYHYEVWVMDWDGFNQRRVTYSDSLKQFPTIGPGNSGIVYTSFINNNADIYHLSLSGGSAEKIFASAAADMAPEISPDGNKVVFSSSINDGNMDIYTCNLDGSNLKRLTTYRGIDSSPAWSPDGSRIAFSSNRSGTVQIYMMNADGSNQQRITFEGRYNDGADWSPDGKLIAYSARREGSYTFDVRIHDLTTNQTYYVTRGRYNDENPSFSPDGRSLAFASDRTGKYQVWTVDIDGMNLKQLTFDGENKHPSWSR